MMNPDQAGGGDAPLEKVRWVAQGVGVRDVRTRRRMKAGGRRLEIERRVRAEGIVLGAKGVEAVLLGAQRGRDGAERIRLERAMQPLVAPVVFIATPENLCPRLGVAKVRPPSTGSSSRVSTTSFSCRPHARAFH
jgi:hypothetical protein